MCAQQNPVWKELQRKKSITLYYCGHALLTSVGVHTFHTWFVSTGGRLEQCGQFGQRGKTGQHFQAQSPCLWIECYFTKKSNLFRCTSCIHFMKYPVLLHEAVPSFSPIREYCYFGVTCSVYTVYDYIGVRLAEQFVKSPVAQEDNSK